MTKCSIIKDLFTAYVSGLGSEDTRALVDEHIETCDDCRNKMTEIQNRVAAQLRDKDARSINVFKTMKKKILMRNVLVAGAATLIVAVLALLIGVRVIDYKPIAYYDGLVTAEVNYANYYTNDENTTVIVTDPANNSEITRKVPVLDIRCARDYYSTNVIGRTIMRDGETVHVEYICYFENLLTRNNTKKDKGEIVFRLVHGELAGDNPIRTEVYYLTDVEAVRNSNLNDKEYDEYRHSGTLIWNGTLEINDDAKNVNFVY